VQTPRTGGESANYFLCGVTFAFFAQHPPSCTQRNSRETKQAPTQENLLVDPFRANNVVGKKGQFCIEVF
jgi:hypothetical protein